MVVTVALRLLLCYFVSQSLIGYFGTLFYHSDQALFVTLTSPVVTFV